MDNQYNIKASGEQLICEKKGFRLIFLRELFVNITWMYRNHIFGHFQSHGTLLLPADNMYLQ